MVLNRTRKRKVECRKKKIAFFFFLLIFIACFSLTIQVKAAGENVYFGSETYEWEMNTESPIGFYATSEDDMDKVFFEVTYDPSVLRYERGAELADPGVIRLAGVDIAAKEYRRIVYFTPLVAGQTEITIAKTVITNVAGTETEVEAKTIQVNIPISRSCQLTGIKINGASVQDFNPTVSTYALSVEPEVEEAQIEVEPSDAVVDISNTTLLEGDNAIYVTVTGSDGQKANYNLNIFRKTAEKVAEPEDKTLDVPQDNASDEKTSLNQFINMNRKQISIVLVIVAALLAFAVLTRKLQKHKRRKKRRRASVAHREEYEESFVEEEQLLNISVTDHLRKMLPVEQIYESRIVENPERELLHAVQQLREEDYQKRSDYLEEDEIEISIEHVTMDFKRELDESSSLKEMVIRTLKGERNTEKYRALEDISFDVMKGEVVGIIGTNGSGKSTILKIISGVLKPTEGNVHVEHQKIQLLTLGTGFDMELTGRENVYLNGAIIGYTREYIDEKYNDIVKFAELEGFMDEKVKNYSSGMVSRLGFAIATVRDTPEILILDEVLSVGDMFFRKKSEKRIQEMIHGGSTVLIVSHSPSVIRKNCTKVIWIEKGHLKMVGDPQIVCTKYEKMQQGVNG